VVLVIRLNETVESIDGVVDDGLEVGVFMWWLHPVEELHRKIDGLNKFLGFLLLDLQFNFLFIYLNLNFSVYFFA